MWLCVVPHSGSKCQKYVVKWKFVRIRIKVGICEFFTLLITNEISKIKIVNGGSKKKDINENFMKYGKNL